MMSSSLLLAFTAFLSCSHSAIIYKTAQNTTDRLTPYNLSFIPDSNIQNTDVLITIDSSITYQSMLGIGGAFTPSASYIFSRLEPQTKNEILSLYFSDNGNKYNMARLTIGSCDFSLISYNFAPYPDDYNLTRFNLTQYDHEFILPFIQSALSMFQASAYSNSTDFMLIASPWSAPGWMKQNGEMTCGVSTCERCKLKDDTRIHQTYADYISKYITAYQQQLKYPIYGLTPQNEPYACPEFYEGMHFDPDTEGKFIADYLGPTLATDHPGLKMYIYDQNKGGMLKWVQKIIVENADAAKYVTGTAVHWYDGDHFDDLNQSHFLAPDYQILATEATEAYDHGDITDPAWNKGEHYAHDMMGDFNNWVVGFIDWNLILDLKGGPDHAGPNLCESDVGLDCGSDAMLIVDPILNKIYPQVFYYYVGHLSRFINKGDMRIEWQMKNITMNASMQIEMTAFYNVRQETVSVVMMNPTEFEWTFQLKDVRSMYDNVSLNGTLPAHSIQTLVY